MRNSKTWLITILFLFTLSPLSATADTGPENISIKNIRLGQTFEEIQEKLKDLGFTIKEEKAKKTYKVKGIRIESEEFSAKLSASNKEGKAKEYFQIYFTTNEGGNKAHLINYTNNASKTPYIASELREKMFQKFGGAVTRSKGTGKFRELYKYYYTNGNRIECDPKNCPNPVTRIRSHNRSITKGDYSPFSTRIAELIENGKTAAVHAQFDMNVREKGDTLYTSNFKIQLSGEAVRRDAAAIEKQIIEAKAEEKANEIQPSSVPDL